MRLKFYEALNSLSLPKVVYKEHHTPHKAHRARQQDGVQERAREVVEQAPTKRSRNTGNGVTQENIGVYNAKVLYPKLLSGFSCKEDKVTAKAKAN